MSGKKKSKKQKGIAAARKKQDKKADRKRRRRLFRSKGQEMTRPNGIRQVGSIAHPDSEIFTGRAAQRARRQYLALLSAVGAPSIARELMEDMIVWQSKGRPRPILLTAWENDWVDGKDGAEDREIKNMKTRLMSYEEWGNRLSIKAAREALTFLANEAKAGRLVADKQVQLKYLADGVSMMTRDTSNAFGASKPTPTQINRFAISVGPQPVRRLKEATKTDEVIDAEFHAIPETAGADEAAD